MASHKPDACEWSLGSTECGLHLNSNHSNFCVLHDPDEHKDVNLFEEELEAKVGSEGANPDIIGIDLSGVVFPKEVDFSGFIFKKSIRFTYAVFTKQVKFTDTQFTGNAHFAHASFWGGANFSRCKFAGAATFVGTSFSGGDIVFSDAEFGGVATFTDAHFDATAQFAESHFFGRALFWDTVFVGEVTFALVHFDNEASFVSTTFYMKAYFQLTTLNSNVRFDHVNLTNVSFWRSDVHLLTLVGCSWAKKTESMLWPLPLRRPRFLLEARSVLNDELELQDRTPPLNESFAHDQAFITPRDYSDTSLRIRWISEIYRQLRLNYESNRQEAEAGDFYIGQMEMRRQDKASYGWPYRFLLGVYRVLAMYGESYQRPAFFYFTFGLLFALLYLWGGFQVGEAQVKYGLGFDPSNLVSFGQDFVRAYVQALTAGGILGTNLPGLSGANLETGSWWVPAVRYINMLLDTFLVGFFVIALRRHFRR